MPSLQGRNVVIFGGSSGIGLATARAALDHGANVTITGRSAERLERAVNGLGAAVRTMVADVADEAATRAVFDGVERVDHVFVAAGTASSGGIAVEAEAMRPAVDARLWGSIYVAKHAHPKMPSDGSITFCSGLAAHRPRRGSAVGTAACAGVEALAAALAVELAPVRVNTVVPGLIDTPLLDGLGAQRDQYLESVAKRSPVGRVGRAEDVAHAVVFLMSNGFVTGTSLFIDGGLRLV